MRQLVLAVVLILIGGGAQAATLDVVGGVLHGASGVVVGGGLYDVEFVDGTCIDLFNGCDGPTDFTFTDAASASLASQALLDQVFLDGVLGAFDTNPYLTNGCVGGSGAQGCSTFTLYCVGCNPLDPINVVGEGAKNLNIPGSPDYDFIGVILYADPDVDFSPFDQTTLASWTYIEPVPEPGTALLLGIGLIGLSTRGRSMRR